MYLALKIYIKQDIWNPYFAGNLYIISYQNIVWIYNYIQLSMQIPNSIGVSKINFQLIIQ